MSTTQQNWATNIPFQAANFHTPATIADVQEIVRRAAKVKVVGARHCFNNIADTTGDMIWLGGMDKSVAIDAARQTATIDAGMTYVELCPILHEAGWALRNMASLPQVTVIGACATATHGSGDGNGNLSTGVSGLEMVMADGEVVTLSRAQDGDRFNGAVVALGGLGVVTKVTLDLVPAYQMQQAIYEMLPLAEVYAHFDEIMGSAYSVSLFTDWRQPAINQVWRKQLLPDGQARPMESEFFGAQAAAAQHHPVDAFDAAPCTEQRGVPGPWYERLPHFHIRSTLIGGDELQTEYFVARQHAVDALRAVERLQPQMAPFLKLTEVRSMTGDNLWLSMAYGQDTVGIHFSWYNRWPAVAPFIPVLEESLAPFQARPHWGKIFAMSPDRVRSLYPRMADFQALRQEFDPQGKFRNAYIEKYIG
ncbi:MAG: D-arabinono-1,4-lactone oxidase [Caldilineaceae bacterium]